jgi:hypothetical protein
VLAGIFTSMVTAVANAGLSCVATYDAVPWYSQTQPTLSSNAITTGSDNMIYSAVNVDGLFSYIDNFTYYHVTDPPINWAWGMFFFDTSYTRLGFFVNIPWGAGNFHEVNSPYHPYTDDDLECYWGFDQGVFHQPYYFDPWWLEETYLGGNYYGRTLP